MVALQLRSMLFTGYLRSVAFLSQAVHSQSIGFCLSRCAPSPTLLCVGAMRSGQLFIVRIVSNYVLCTYIGCTYIAYLTFPHGTNV